MRAVQGIYLWDRYIIQQWPEDTFKYFTWVQRIILKYCLRKIMPMVKIIKLDEAYIKLKFFRQILLIHFGALLVLKLHLVEIIYLLSM